MSSSKCEQLFWNEFLNLYRSLPYLWWDNADILAMENRENYRMKSAQAKEKLLLYVKQRYPNADLPFVQRKIHNFRCGFHREYRKKQKLEAIGKIHRPLLWYYKKLLFLVDEENAMDLIDEDNNISANFDINDISSCKSHPVTETHPITEAETNTAINEISEIIDIKKEPVDENEIKAQVKVQNAENDSSENSLAEIIELQSTENDGHDYSDIINFEPEIVKLELLKNSEENEVTSNNIDKPNHEITSFITAAQIRQRLKRPNQTLDTEKPNSIPTVKPKKVKLNDFYNLVERAVTQSERQSKEDTFDVIGRKIAYDFREMNRSQRIFAEKIINDVIYYGKANRLRSTFRFSPST